MVAFCLAENRRCLELAGRLARFRRRRGSTRFDLEIDINFAAIIKLADGLRTALAVVELRVNLVVDVRIKSGKPVRPVFAYNVSFHITGMSIGEIDDGIAQWAIG
jgi:hypothetical protein